MVIYVLKLELIPNPTKKEKTDVYEIHYFLSGKGNSDSIV